MIELQEFIKVYGSEGQEFFQADEDEAVELYTGLDILNCERVLGYGVPIDSNKWEVFQASREAENFYKETVGELTSSNFIFDPSGVRERVEFDYV